MMTDTWLFDTEISGMIRGLKINGVEVAPLVEAELDRTYPERLELRPSDLEGLRRAFDVVDQMWAPTIERARALRSEKLHQRVGGEYSFVETLRHLLYATDSWLIRMVLGVPNACHEWGMPPDLPPEAAPDTGPDLDDVLAVRTEQEGRLREWINQASEDDLSRIVAAPDPTGHPQGQHKILDCFHLVFDEEWWHHQYATRDLRSLM